MSNDYYRISGAQPSHENASDALFVKLFSSDNGVPMKFFDLILRTVQDPRFIPKGITFNNCGDFWLRLGRCRDVAWSRVEERARNITTFPEVVLEGRSIRTRGIGFCRTTKNPDSGEIQLGI